MSYSIILVLKKQPENKEGILEIKKYIEEKEGKILSLDESRDANLKPNKKSPQATIVKLQIDIKSEEIEKVKRKINHEKGVISCLVEKLKIIKKDKEKPEKKVLQKKKEESDKAEKVLDSMQEEEKKIKDLDSTLDKILNE